MPKFMSSSETPNVRGEVARDLDPLDPPVNYASDLPTKPDLSYQTSYLLWLFVRPARKQPQDPSRFHWQHLGQLYLSTAVVSFPQPRLYKQVPRFVANEQLSKGVGWSSGAIGSGRQSLPIVAQIYNLPVHRNFGRQVWHQRTLSAAPSTVSQCCGFVSRGSTESDGTFNSGIAKPIARARAGCKIRHQWPRWWRNFTRGC